jgi:hypothetical protein
MLSIIHLNSTAGEEDIVEDGLVFHLKSPMVGVNTFVLKTVVASYYVEPKGGQQSFFIYRDSLSVDFAVHISSSIKYSSGQNFADYINGEYATWGADVIEVLWDESEGKLCFKQISLGGGNNPSIQGLIETGIKDYNKVAIYSLIGLGNKRMWMDIALGPIFPTKKCFQPNYGISTILLSSKALVEVEFFMGTNTIPFVFCAIPFRVSDIRGAAYYSTGIGGSIESQTYSIPKTLQEIDITFYAMLGGIYIPILLLDVFDIIGVLEY